LKSLLVSAEYSAILRKSSYLTGLAVCVNPPKPAVVVFHETRGVSREFLPGDDPADLAILESLTRMVDDLASEALGEVYRPMFAEFWRRET